MAGSAPMGLNPDTPVFRNTILTGRIDRITPEWIVVRTEEGLAWVPRGVVLMVEVAER